VQVECVSLCAARLKSRMVVCDEEDFLH
jgi:hypothetical protein